VGCCCCRCCHLLSIENLVAKKKEEKEEKNIPFRVPHCLSLSLFPVAVMGPLWLVGGRPAAAAAAGSGCVAVVLVSGGRCRPAGGGSGDGRCHLVGVAGERGGSQDGGGKGMRDILNL
jgi:hypothetical protein